METTWAATSRVSVAWSGSTANEKPRGAGLGMSYFASI